MTQYVDVEMSRTAAIWARDPAPFGEGRKLALVHSLWIGADVPADWNLVCPVQASHAAVSMGVRRVKQVMCLEIPDLPIFAAYQAWAASLSAVKACCQPLGSQMIHIAAERLENDTKSRSLSVSCFQAASCGRTFSGP